MKKFVLIAAVLMVSVSSFALFRTSDIVFILAAADTPGGGGSQYWKTDVWVTNPGTVALGLTIEYLPSGEAGNPTDTANRRYLNWPAPILPKGTLFIPNVVGKIRETFPTAGAFGAVVFYGEKPTGDYANIVVTSRTYTPKNVSDTSQGYFGQDIPGTPWYYYIDPDYSTSNLDAHWLMGLEENSAFRTNVGIVNGSINFILDVKMELYDSAGAKVNEITLPNIGALAHVQFNQILAQKFGLSDASNYSLRVSIAKSTAIDPNPPTVTFPALYTYGSKVDNKTGDPNYIEATYYVSETFIDTFVNCVWPPQ